MVKEAFIALLFFLLVIEINLASAALGISPSKQYVDFKPGMQLEYSFSVYADAEQKIELYAKDEFSDLVEFDTKELIGGGGFTVKIKLPQEIEKPGKHVLIVGAREKSELEEGLGVSIAVQAPIIIFVPYPGEYAEISFSANNANVGELIKFEVGVSSMGKEPIFANTRIEISNFAGKIETLELGSMHIENQKGGMFKKNLNTSLYKPGDYKAEAIVDYGAGVARAETNFRIGFLFVNITNSTKEIFKSGIKPLQIDVESLWNNPLENVYVEVYVSKDGKNISNFQTPSTNLGPWEKKSLIGYIGTDNLEITDYSLKMKLNYARSYSLFEGNLKIVKKSNIIVFVVVGLSAVILILVAYFIVRRFMRKNDKNENQNWKKRTRK